MTMNNQWYYCIKGERYGPLSFDELKALVESKSLSKHDLVWCCDFGSDWRKVEQIPELGLSEVEYVSNPPPLKRKEIVVEFEPAFNHESFRPSVLKAVSMAWQRMTNLLFRPFDIARWCGIGFCAWLAALGNRKISNVQGWNNLIASYNKLINETEGSNLIANIKPEIDKGLSEIAGKIESSVVTPESITVIIILSVLLALAFNMVIIYFKSRGDFMVVYRWYNPNDNLGQSWSASCINSMKLFKWRVSIMLIVMLVHLYSCWSICTQVILAYYQSGFEWDIIYLHKFIGAAAVCLGSLIITFCVDYITVAFVVPVMHWHGVSIFKAWGKVIKLFNQFPGAVLIYITFSMAISTAGCIAATLVVYMTCCIGGMPYIYSVVTLPVYLFLRGYPICFISQWKDNFIPGVDLD